MKLLLASKSAARRAMLAAAGVPFGLCDAECDEESAKEELRGRGASALAIASGLAALKARAAVADRGTLVLGADQTLERDDGTMLDKPRSAEEAAAQLRGLRGHAHRLHSAAAVAEAGEIVWTAEESVTLHVREFTDSFLEHYLEQEYESIRYNVGGYAIEGRGLQLFERIDGSYFAILGLPLLPLLDYLRAREVIES